MEKERILARSFVLLFVLVFESKRAKRGGGEEIRDVVLMMRRPEEDHFGLRVEKRFMLKAVLKSKVLAETRKGSFKIS